jgi:hypothetical protein
LLAVKLHKRKRPWLGFESYLLPVARWDIADRHIRSWMHTLTRGRGAKNPWWPNDQIHYLTLVKVPDDHPVKIYVSWGARYLQQDEDPFRPLREWDPEVKEAIGSWDPENGEPYCFEPEMILGAPLAPKHILWTKDIRLLRRKPSGPKQPRRDREFPD